VTGKSTFRTIVAPFAIDFLRVLMTAVVGCYACGEAIDL